MDQSKPINYGAPMLYATHYRLRRNKDNAEKDFNGRMEETRGAMLQFAQGSDLYIVECGSDTFRMTWDAAALQGKITP